MLATELMQELVSAISTYGEDLEIRIDDGDITDTWVNEPIDMFPAQFVIIGQ